MVVYIVCMTHDVYGVARCTDTPYDMLQIGLICIYSRSKDTQVCVSCVTSEVHKQGHTLHTLTTAGSSCTWEQSGAVYTEIKCTLERSTP